MRKARTLTGTGCLLSLVIPAVVRLRVDSQAVNPQSVESTHASTKADSVQQGGFAAEWAIKQELFRRIRRVQLRTAGSIGRNWPQEGENILGYEKSRTLGWSTAT